MKVVADRQCNGAGAFSDQVGPHPNSLGFPDGGAKCSVPVMSLLDQNFFLVLSALCLASEDSVLTLVTSQMCANHSGTVLFISITFTKDGYGGQPGKQCPIGPTEASA